MNNLLSKTTMLFLVVSLFSLSACNKDEIAKDIEGLWTVDSYKVNGEEQLGLLVTNMTLEFGEAKDGKGDYTQKQTFLIIPTEITGTYTTNNDDNTITISATDFEGEQTMDVDISGDNGILKNDTTYISMTR